MAQLMPLLLTVCCFSKIQIGFTFHLGSSGKRAVKRVCVCGPADAAASQNPIISCVIKIQTGLPFRYRLTQVVLEKSPLNICHI